jgi:hypothetical protein
VWYHLLVPLFGIGTGKSRGLTANPRLEAAVKSNVSDYLEIVEAIYKDASMKCIADVSDLRDLKTIRSRVEGQGISFLTITLPNFCKDFERSLADGIIDPTFFQFFKKNGRIPAFLQGFVGQIFDRETGRMRTNVTPTQKSGDSVGDYVDSIESVRQICLAFKKIEIECTHSRVQSALTSYVSVEQAFETFSVSEEDYASFTSVSFMLWSDLIRTSVVSDLRPRHGPGATAERVSGNQKFVWQFWNDRLEPYFPVVGNAYPLGIPTDSLEFEKLTIVSQDDELPVRVTPVPKTLKGPRIIAIEPACMQYVQQGIRDDLYGRLESFRYTAGHVNFRDQSVNQKLAVLSSIDGRLATIDLSDASDRVPRSLALEMFSSNPDFMDAIDACRTTKAQLPDGTIIGPLRKFASMGSALCFPVEAMYFYTICIVALLKGMHLPETPGNVFSVSRDVYVYGDDIIVPSAYAIVVLDHLRKYNCKVNSAKTFWSGCFRESCGVDSFAGYEVTPTYITQEIPENKQQASRIISWVAAGNHFYKRGYWRTAQLIFSKVERIVGYLPYVSDDSEVLGRISFLPSRITERWNLKILPSRWNERYQRLEVRGLVSRPVYRTDRLGGYGALVKSFIKLEGQSFWDRFFRSSEENSLEQTALHGAVTLKRRWAPSHRRGRP